MVVMSDLRVSYLVGRADRILRTALEDSLSEVDLTLSEVTTLSVLATRPGLSSARLARRALVTPQAMHKVIRSLEQGGLIERSSAPDGGRALEAYITDKGRAALEEVDARMRTIEEDFLAPLGMAERRQLRKVLAKVSRVHADGAP
jgi:DNA-binding MarR family transcriptional regulator